MGWAHPGASPINVTMNLTDRPAYSPAFVAVPESSSVSIHLNNTGNYTHTFTLSATAGAVLSPSATPSQVDAFFRANGTLANVSLAPGAQGWANVTFNASVPTPASFEFASVVPYQFQAGMWGFLNLTSAGPGLQLSENTTNAPGFVPSILAVAPGQYPINLNVFVTNLGSLSHTFTVASQSNVSVPLDFGPYFAQHTPLVNAVVPAAGGGTVWANFTVPAPGVYEYICEIPGHFAAGMYGFLYVGVSPPAPVAAPSTALVDTWVLAGSASLLGLGGVLVAIATFTGRFPRSPPHH